MRKLLNTLYVTTEGASLRKDGENLVAEVEGTERARVPLHMLGSVVVFGGIYLSPPLMEACALGGITMVLLDRVGRFRARIEGPVTGNVLLRRAQYRASDRPEPIVRSLVVGKVANQRAVLMRALRDYGGEYTNADRAAIGAVVDRLAQILRRVEFADDPLDRLRGAEGEAADLYFSQFNLLIRSPIPRWPGPGVRAGRRSIRSMRCSRSSMFCSPTIAAAPPKRSGSIRRQASCIATGLAGRALLSTSWRSCAPSLPTAWRSP